MSNNQVFLNKNIINRSYQIGLSVILALPILTIPPWFFPPDFGKSIVFRSVLAILIFFLAYQLLFRKTEITLPTIKKNPVIWALSALFGVFLLATIFSVDPNFSLWGSPYRGGGFITFAFYFVFAIMTFILFKKEDPPTGEASWKKAWIFSIFVGLLVSFVAIIQYYGLFNIVKMEQPPSTMGNPILLAIYLLLLFFPTLSFAIKELRKPLKIFYIFGLGIFLFTILISGTRAVYLGIFAGILYFLLAYPKKIKILKISLTSFLTVIFLLVLYANVHPQLPKVLQNRTTIEIINQLSVKKALNDNRFKAWQIIIKEVTDKPILGWGPENFAVGFDKNYDPKIITYDASSSFSNWWDKAHNIFLDIGAEAGILGILTYIALFIVLFLQLQRLKTIEARAIQATLIGYLVANFFSFDSFSTYLVFFLLIAYSLHLVLPENPKLEILNPKQIQNPKYKITKKIAIIILFFVLVIFLWQYNFVPLYVNSKIITAEILVNNNKCNQGFSVADDALKNHTFLDAYIRLQYVSFLKTCSGFNPANDTAYAKKGISLLTEATQIQPLYSRAWLFLGSFTNILANKETNTATKQILITEAYQYLNQASKLAPRHQEITITQAQIAQTAKDYIAMKNYSNACVALNPNIGACYFNLALSEIYLKNTAEAEKDMQTAIDKGYNINSKTSLNQLSDAYSFLADWKDLAPVYEKLTEINPNNTQYHSTLAFIYAKLGQYDKARQEANTVLRLSPESKPNVDAFLKTLP